MPIAFRTQGWAYSNGASGVSIFSGAHQVDDLEVVYLTSTNNQPSVTINGTGWQRVVNNFLSAGSYLNVWWRRVTAGQPAGVDIQTPASGSSSAGIACFTGAVAATALDVVTTGGRPSNNTQGLMPSHVTTKGDAVAIAITVDGTAGYGASRVATGLPPSWTRVIDSPDAGFYNQFLAYRLPSGAATIPPSTEVGGWTYSRSDGSTNTNTSAILTFSGNTLPSAPTWAASGGTAEGATVDRAQATPLAWVPSDPEGDAQVGYDLRYRVLGSLSAWAVISRPTAGATASGTIPANTLAGKTEVQVRTYDAEGAGAWSTSRTFTATDATGGATSAIPTRLDPATLLALAQTQRALNPAVT